MLAYVDLDRFCSRYSYENMMYDWHLGRMKIRGDSVWVICYDF